MLKGNGQEQEMPTLSLSELEGLQFLCEMVNIPDEVYSTLLAVRIDLKDEGIYPSDRRFKQSLSILRGKALMEQRQEVKVKDILMLEHTLWENVGQKSLVSEIINNHALDVVSRTIQNIEGETKEVLKSIKGTPSTDQILEANQKLKEMVNELKRLKPKHLGRNDIDEAIQKIIDSQKEISEAILDPIEVI